MAPRQPLTGLLEETRRRLRWAAIREGLLVILLTGLAALLFGSALAAAASPALFIALAEAALLLAAGILLAVRFGRALPRALSRPANVARWIDRELADKRNRHPPVSLRSAVELSEPQKGESTELASYAIDQALSYARSVQPARLVAEAAWPREKRALFGIVALSLGTSGVVFASSDEPIIEPDGRLHAFCHAAPGKWHLMGVMLSAAGSLP